MPSSEHLSLEEGHWSQKLLTHHLRGWQHHAAVQKLIYGSQKILAIISEVGGLVEWLGGDIHGEGHEGAQQGEDRLGKLGQLRGLKGRGVRMSTGKRERWRRSKGGCTVKINTEVNNGYWNEWKGSINRVYTVYITMPLWENWFPFIVWSRVALCIVETCKCRRRLPSYKVGHMAFHEVGPKCKEQQGWEFWSPSVFTCFSRRNRIFNSSLLCSFISLGKENNGSLLWKELRTFYC